jgi:autotransporter-associated beta strand protein
MKPTTKMKTKIRKLLIMSAAIAASLGTAGAQTSYFVNFAGGDWNVAANWDLDFGAVNVVPAEGTNASITTVGGVTVDYNVPMAAASFGALTVDGGATLNINAAGFVQDLAFTGLPHLALGSGTVNVGAGGVWVATNGSTATIGLGGVVNIGGNAYWAPVFGTPPLAISAGGSLNVSSGGALTLADGGNTTVSGTVTVAGDLAMTNSGVFALLTGSAMTVDGGTVQFSGNTGSVNIGEGTSSDNNAGAAFTNNAGQVEFAQQVVIRSRDTRFVSEGGTLDLLGGLNYGVSGNDGRQWVRINGGVANLNDVNINRAVLNQGGLLVQDGVVNSTSIRIGSGVAAANSRQDGGVWTNAGAFYVADRNNAATSGGRRVYFVMNGGELVTQGADGIIINNQGQPDTSNLSNVGGTLDVNGGTITTEGIQLNGPFVAANAYARFELSGGTIYLGSVGLVANNSGPSMTTIFTLTGGTLAAKDSWVSSANLPLGGLITFKTADAANVARDITLDGVLSSSGGVIKTGAGVLTLNGANTYAGVTAVNAGTLALGAAGSLVNSVQVYVDSGATFDVSAAGGFSVGSAKVLTGLGNVNGDVTVASGGIINPGSNTLTGTLTIAGSLNQFGDAVNHFDLPNSPGPANDRLVVAGDVNVSGVNTLEIVGGGSPGNVHVLIQYGGAFNGTLANFNLVGAAGILTNDVVNKTIGFIITSSVRSPGDVVWQGDALNNVWDVVNTENWLNGGLPDYFVTGDNVLFDATGIANPNVEIVGNVAPASVTVGAAGNYTFGGAGSIAGTGALLKTNTGTLTINTLNSYTGPTLISNGVVEASSIANGAQNSSLGAATSAAENLVIDGGTLRYTGANVSSDRQATIGANGANLGVTADTTTLTLSGALVGDGGITKTGAGTLVLGTANTYTGGSVINAGTLQFNNASGGGAGGITNNAAALRLNGQIVLNNTVEFNGNTALLLSGVGSGNAALRGAWSGGGQVNITFVTQTAGQTFTIGGAGSGGGHMWDFSGTVDFGANDGFLRINNDNSTFNFGSSNATFNLGTGTGTLNQRNGSTTTHLGALQGGPNTKIAGRGNTGTSGTTTYSIGGKNLSTTFEGEINNGSGTTAITKVGSGKLTLTGVSIYTGTTTIEEGILQVDGALGNTFVNVNGGTLAGGGSIDGTVNVNFGGVLAPGSAGIGNMTFNGYLTLGGETVVEVNKGVGSDLILANAGVSFGGDLIVQNIGGALAVGDTFQIFSTAGFGDFVSISGSPGAGLAWSFDPNTGVLSVVSAGELLTVVQTGSNLEFSWTDPTFKLQAQTNSLSTGLSGNWGDYPGGSTSPVNVTIDPAQGTVFFRLMQEMLMQ